MTNTTMIDTAEMTKSIRSLRNGIDSYNINDIFIENN
jgi:hypothetical protein